MVLVDTQDAYVLNKGCEKVEEAEEKRCKNCGYREMSPVSYPQYWCTCHDDYVNGEASCNDWKRKDGEQK